MSAIHRRLLFLLFVILVAAAACRYGWHSPYTPRSNKPFGRSHRVILVLLPPLDPETFLGAQPAIGTRILPSGHALGLMSQFSDGCLTVESAKQTLLSGVDQAVTDARKVPSLRDLAGKQLGIEDWTKLSPIAVLRRLHHRYPSFESNSTTLFLVSIGSPGDSRSQSHLKPIAVLGNGAWPGVITSPSTRWGGLVTTLDIAPTVLQLLGQPIPRFMAGRPIEIAPSQEIPEWTIAVLDSSATRQHFWRPEAVRIATYLSVAAVLLALFFVSRHLVFLRWAARLLQFGLALVILPVTYLLVQFPVWMLIACAVLLLFGERFSRKFGCYVAAFLVAFLCLDALLGTPWTRLSYLSYSPITGARFYGVGNEYMGCLIAACLMAVGLWHRTPGRDEGTARDSIWERWAMALLFAAVAFIIGYHRIGANFGGGLTAAATFSAAYLLFSRGRLRASDWVLILAITVAFGFLLGASDYLAPLEHRSHVGMALHRIQYSGASLISVLLSRKLHTALGVVAFTGWIIPMLALIPLVWRLASKPPRVFGPLFAEYLLLKGALQAMVIGAVVAVLTNDSGVVSAGTMLSVVIPCLLMTAIGLKVPERRI